VCSERGAHDAIRDPVRELVRDRVAVERRMPAADVAPELERGMMPVGPVVEEAEAARVPRPRVDDQGGHDGGVERRLAQDRPAPRAPRLGDDVRSRRGEGEVLGHRAEAGEFEEGDARGLGGGRDRQDGRVRGHGDRAARERHGLARGVESDRAHAVEHGNAAEHLLERHHVPAGRGPPDLPRRLEAHGVPAARGLRVGQSPPNEAARIVRCPVDDLPLAAHGNPARCVW
jgi:hypothetical protein